MFFVGLCSLWMAPAGAAWIEELYEEESKVTEFEMLIPGRFQAMSSGNRVTYAESLSDDKKQMNRVFIADGNTLVVAERGTQFVRPETGSRFLELYEGRRYDLVPGSAEMKVLDFDHYAVRLAEQDAERRRLKKDAVPTLDLINSNNNEYLAQLHWRISLVVLVPVITLIAFPLSKVNPRQGRFAKLFPALILLILYVAGLAGLTSVVEKGKVSPWLSLWMVHLLFFVLGLFLIALPHIKRRIYVRRIRA
ncbi:MAG: LPS export ABC transporter permease LptF, partial [Venatoribacter sp.]